MQKYLLIISCSGTKRDTPGRRPAYERYNGRVYQTIHKAIREGYFPVGHLDILIISAKFGLLKWDDEIENYNQEMTTEQADKLRREVQEDLSSYLKDKDYEEVFISMGAKYRLTLEGFDWGQHSNINFAKGIIGQQQSQVRAWIKAVFFYGGSKSVIGPRQLAQTGLRLLEEAVLAFLFMERPRYLIPQKIANTLGIEKDRHEKDGYRVIGGVLSKLEKDERVERNKPTYAGWRLTESESKARNS